MSGAGIDIYRMVCQKEIQLITEDQIVLTAMLMLKKAAEHSLMNLCQQ